MLGKNPLDFIVPGDAKHLVGDVLKKLKKGTVSDYSEKDNNIRKDGKVISCQWFNRPLLDSNGDVLGILALAQDITRRRQAEEALLASEQNFRQIAETIHEVFWVGSVDWGEVHYVSPAYEEIWGRSCQSLCDDPLSWLDAVHAEDRECVKAAVTEKGCSTSFDPKFPEYRIVRPDGAVRWILARAYPVHDESGEVTRVVGIAGDITERKQAQQQILQYQDQLKSLASQLVLAEEQERQRIAIHLHDDVCQNLAYAKMRLQIVSATLEDQAQIEDMAEASDTLTRMMQDVRSLTFELSPPILTEFGLEAAISHWLEEEVEQKHGLVTAFIDDGQAKPLTEDIRALLFRSVRELLANIVKHSQAQRVEVSVSREDDQVLIRLEDDGVGFATGEVVVGHDNGGYGLFSIRERLSQMGGSLEIDSSPGQGCRSLLRASLQEA